MTTQQKFDQANRIENDARQIKRDFVSTLLSDAEAMFATVEPLEIRVHRSSIDITVTENSPRVSFQIQEDWNWDNPGFEVKASMGSCTGARAKDFLAMARFAPAMEQAIKHCELQIANQIDFLNKMTDAQLEKARELRKEAQQEANKAAKAKALADLNNFNNNILNQGKQELAEPTRVQLLGDWTPNITAIEIAQAKNQDSFTVKVWMPSLNGEKTWTDTARVCGKFKKNVMNLFA